MPKSKKGQTKKKTNVKPLSLYGVSEREALKDLISYRPAPKSKNKKRSVNPK